MKAIEEIKRDCSLVADGLLIPEDAFTPQAAKALLLAIENLEAIHAASPMGEDSAWYALESIRALFL